MLSLTALTPRRYTWKPSKVPLMPLRHLVEVLSAPLDRSFVSNGANAAALHMGGSVISNGANAAAIYMGSLLKWR